ncbi:vitelline membrane outer layer protein 1-like [Podarcis raffonei]|uniref:vitelline membrane outer layer protein 1-like n=1 Tax=Podarcis raffonei TaxID=65483 RepID=UPI002329471F|nr:vitelline membrane outer layer protein 1-like [Podarcis raffonei]
MDLSIGTALFLIFSSYLSDAKTRNYTIELSVPNGGPCGKWGPIEFCRKGYANGFTLKVDPWERFQVFKDDTSLNGIRLICTDGSEIQSAVGPLGKWTKTETCPEGSLISFSLRVQEERGILLDDTSADNIRFSCEHGAVLTGHSNDWGTFGPWSAICPQGAICGIRTKVEPQMEKGDNTALNDVKFYCCD